MLKDGGRLFATFFLMDAVSRGSCAGKDGLLGFRHRIAYGWLGDTAVPEVAVAYDSEALRGMLAEAAFQQHRVLRGHRFAHIRASTQDTRAADRPPRSITPTLSASRAGDRRGAQHSASRTCKGHWRPS